ncbi:tetratricopeptide repeat protein [Pseudobacteriovorax antillogorgiicola]|uniref:Tetratricopeptide repeat-containing protein n=1 Tax=Pseudobacteriovorax antillogorgiicola TaxID=1513793 RepID=A0A1Y6B885_9BACT|nr:hypothetical protein [Pseudobacteriovorax antillogorgiicola]TCS58876.1 hypothetical protein EDD56_102391 [Pseudobacteriovorax antillogorgiicola]SME93768.1 hypothetical protein SAMN06296036_10252 [Pseudobacteriovorax antillogorgiicola]
MIHRIIAILILLKPIAALGDPYQYLVFSPEIKSGFPYRVTFAPPPRSSQKTEKASTEIALSAIPSQELTLTRGDRLLVEVPISNATDQVRWVVNGKVVCRQSNCIIRTINWSTGTLPLILQVSNQQSFIEYHTKLKILPSSFNAPNSDVPLPLETKVRSPDRQSQDARLVGFSVKGVAYTSQDIRTVETRLSRRFNIPNDRLLRTSPDAYTIIYSPRQWELQMLGASTVKIGSSDLNIDSGVYRLRVPRGQVSPVFNLNGLSFQSFRGTDTIIHNFKDRTLITVLQGYGEVKISANHFTTMNASFQNLFNRQKSEGIPADRFILHGGQSISLANGKLSIASILSLRTIKILKQTNPEWFANDQPSKGKSSLSDNVSFEENVDIPTLLRGNDRLRSEAYWRLGINQRAQLYWRRLLRATPQQLYPHQRLVEAQLSRGDWTKATEALEEFQDQGLENEVMNYYRAVALFFSKQGFAAKQQFKRTLWTAKNPIIVSSSEEFLRFLDKDKSSHFSGKVHYLNNNNPLRFSDSLDLPEGLIHRASQGIELHGEFNWNFTEDEFFAVALAGSITAEQWLQDGLSELGYRHLMLGVNTTVDLTTTRIQVTPYIARSDIGSYPGLDHFGIHLITQFRDWKGQAKFIYDHSKNLDPAANDESFIDPITRLFTESEDRSRQLQKLKGQFRVTDALLLSVGVNLIDFRADSSQDEDGLGYGVDLDYFGAISLNWSWSGKLGFYSETLEARSDQTISLEGSPYYRWSPLLRLSSPIYWRQGNSSEEAQSYSQFAFGLGLEASL